MTANLENDVTQRLGYLVADADNHYYETPDCFSRYIDPKFAEKAITANQRPDGSWDVRVGDRPYKFMDPKFDKTNKPGSIQEVLSARSENVELKWSDSYSKDYMLKAYKDRDERLLLMDIQGIEQTIMLPTFAASVDGYLMDDVEQSYANWTSFNTWLENEWGFDYAGRIISPPHIPLLDVERAVTELERVLAAGARVIHIRPGPTGSGRSPADPWYDPFWARINEARVPVAIHTWDYRYPEVAAAWGHDPEAPLMYMSSFQWAFCYVDRAIMDMLGSLIYGNLFARFPNIKVMSIENGSSWARYFLDTLDHKKDFTTFGPWIGGRPAGLPSDIFKEHVLVAPFPEEDVGELVSFLGAQSVLFGSDYPHPEGLAVPLEFASLLDGCSDAEIKTVMRDNLVGLLER